MYSTGRFYILLGFLFLFYLLAEAQETPDTVRSKNDSIPFVMSSLLVITPGSNIYSVFGRTALRMQCPSKGLDYCFSFEMDAGPLDILKFIAGQSRAAFLPVPTNSFIDEYYKEGRGVRQYELNLTPHEKQELWRALDDDMMQGAHRKFNLLQNNCTSLAIIKVESILDSEYLSFGRLPEQMYYRNGHLLCWMSRRFPWAQFIFMSFGGTETDAFWQTESKITPELVIPVLRNSTFRKSDASAVRPVLTGAEATLVPLRTVYKSSPLTPNIFFGAVLAVVVVFTAVRFVRQQYSQGRVMKVVGWMADVVYLVASFFLLYVTLVSGLFGVHWNWLLLSFNPLPLLVWLLWRHSAAYPRVYLAYAAVLVAFVAMVPWLTSQLLLSHYLLVASMAVACVGKGLSVNPSHNSNSRPPRLAAIL